MKRQNPSRIRTKYPIFRKAALLSVLLLSVHRAPHGADAASSSYFSFAKEDDRRQKLVGILRRSADPLLVRFRTLDDVPRAASGSVAGFLAGRTVRGAANKAVRLSAAAYLTSEIVGYLSAVVDRRAQPGLGEVVDLADSAVGGARNVLHRWKDAAVEAVRETGRSVPAAVRAAADEDPYFSGGFAAGSIIALMM
eukprot:CAMPEP_0194323726 /NCGR_PEP_ID=MMETSP0171-20130528/25924_1 /TAXON_ID=218684 /ORGANISM="Corethron pennatum, Strain L29A3" /LENGTH=194 /DNA_ID=CAMNT_0039082435 /DNA_START=100 /DNA_END=684 /DNA_ORIENTATION=-